MQQLFFPPRIVCLSTMDERLFFSQFFSLFFSSTSFTLHFTTSDFLAAMCCTRCKIASTDILIYEFPRFLSSVLHYSDELMHFKCSHSRIECLWMKLCLINQQFFNFHTLLNLKFFFPVTDDATWIFLLLVVLLIVNLGVSSLSESIWILVINWPPLYLTDHRLHYYEPNNLYVYFDNSYFCCFFLSARLLWFFSPVTKNSAIGIIQADPYEIIQT